MNRIFFPFCSFLMIISIIVSCKKESSETYPKKYVCTDIIYGEVNTYTNSGDKNEPDKIYSFLENFGINNWMLYHSSGYNLVTGSLLNIYEDQLINMPFKLFDEIELISNSRAKITSNDTIINFDIIRKDGILYFQSLDTIPGRIYLGEPDNRPYYMKPSYYWNEKLKYSPIHVDTVFTAGIGGSGYYFKYKPCIYAKENKDEIQISYTCYVEKNMIRFDWGDDDFYDSNYDAVQNIQNDFNKNYLLSYKIDENFRRDTIVYKTNTVIFKKK